MLLVSGLVSVPKPLSQIQRSTRWLLQGLSPRPSFGGFGLRLDKTSLTFTVDDWDDAQTVTVTAEEDDDGVTDAVATLTHTISGGGYASTTVPNVEVSMTCPQ